jgi:hypothetical protein
MLKKLFSLIGLAALMVLLTGILTAAAPVPVTTFTLVQGLPAVMNVGDTYTVVVQVASDQQFLSAQALPDIYYPGRGVVAVQGGDHTGRGDSAVLNVTFTAKSPFAKAVDGIVTVSVVVGVRYSGGYTAVQRYDFSVLVP